MAVANLLQPGHPSEQRHDGFVKIRHVHPGDASRAFAPLRTLSGHRQAPALGEFQAFLRTTRAWEKAFSRSHSSCSAWQGLLNCH